MIFHSLDCSDNDSDLSYQSISSQINEKLEDELNFHTLIPDCDYNEFEKSIEIFENKPEKETNLNLNSTLKSESVGMRPPLLTAKPINSVNMQEISDNLDKIEHLLLNRKEDQKQVSSSTFKSMNKSTKHQLSSITSTIAKINSSPSTDPNTKNSSASSATMILRKSPEIVQSASPIPTQTNLNSMFSQYDRNKVTSSGGSYRRSALNYENYSISQNQNKRKIISLSPIMTSSRADLNAICNNTPKKPPQLNFNILTNSCKLETSKQQVKIEFDNEEEEDVEVDEKELKKENEETTIKNAYSNYTYGIDLSPKINDNHVELNNFIEENKQRIKRLRNKRIQKNT